MTKLNVYVQNFSMKQRTNKTDAAAVVRRTPGKLSIAERMKLRRREKYCRNRSDEIYYIYIYF